MPIYFEKVNPSTTVEAIAAFEKDWNVTLPEDYKQFLLKTNGGKGFGNNLVPYVDNHRTKIRDCEEFKSFAYVDIVFGLLSPNGDLHTVALHDVNVIVKNGDAERTSCLPNTLVIAVDGGGHNMGKYISG